jgi:hypothetical protein
MRPIAGAAKAAINRKIEKAAKTHERGTPMPELIGSARIAAR